MSNWITAIIPYGGFGDWAVSPTRAAAILETQIDNVPPPVFGSVRITPLSSAPRKLGVLDQKIGGCEAEPS
jgi:hypothetical protein